MSTLETLIAINKKSFEKNFAAAPAFVAYAPGRINIIGEHTDYNEGLSMPCAINRWVTISMLKGDDKTIHIVSSDFNDEMIFELGAVYEPQNIWQRFIYGCIILFNEVVKIPTGFKAVITGNVPVGSGVSSSAALEVAFMNALNHFTNNKLDNLAVIKLCQQVEHQYLKVKSGLLDQYASQFSRAGKVMTLDFQKLSHQYIEAVMPDYVWVLCDSKVKRSLSASKYTERVEETQSALHTLRNKFEDIDGFRTIETKHLAFIEDENQQKRLRHFITENERVIAAQNAFANNDMPTLGKLITASHYSLKNDYEVSCDELDFLVDAALNSTYCIGSRIMGGGFGGCTINLVHKNDVANFSNYITTEYQKRFNIETEINRYEIVDGAGIFID